MPSVFLAGPSRAAPFFFLSLRGRQFVFFSGDVRKPALFFSGDKPAFYFCGDGHCSSRHSNDGTAGGLAVFEFSFAVDFPPYVIADCSGFLVTFGYF